MFRISVWSSWIAASVAMSTLAFAQENLLDYAPAEVNSLATVKVRELLDSPFGKKNKWADEFREAYASGMISAPPYVDEVVRGADFRPSTTDSHPSWSIFRMRTDAFIAKIAKHEQAAVEKTGDTFGVDSPRGVYFIQLGQKVLGVAQPGDRQFAAKWARRVKDKSTPKLPSHLTAAHSQGDAQFTLSVDLSDMLPAEPTRRWIETFATPELGDVKKLAELFASTMDVVVRVKATDKLVAQLQIDFGEPVGERGQAVKTVVLTWLGEIGAHVENLADAKLAVDGKSVVLENEIGEPAFKRLLSLVRAPTMAAAIEEGDSPVSKANPTATKRYYDAVVGYVEDLLRMKKKTDDYKKTAAWHDSYARKIEDLSTAGVDPDVKYWGYETAKGLRALAGSLRGLPVEIDKLERKIRMEFKPWYVRSGTTPWGYYFTPEGGTVDSNLSEVRAKQQAAIDAAEGQRDQIWTMIEEDRAAAVAKYREATQVDLTKKK